MDGVCSILCSSGSFKFYPEWEIGNSQEICPAPELYSAQVTHSLTWDFELDI